MKEPPRDNELPSEDELKELPREALMAYAARCAMRVQPLVTANSFGDLDQETIRMHIEAVDIAITISAASYTAKVSQARTAARAAARAVVGVVSRAAANAAARSAIHSADYAADAYAKTPEVDTVYARAAIEASREDYEFLKQPKEDNENKHVAIFAKPLWQRDGNNGEVSQKWNKMLAHWKQGLNDLGLDDIAIRHHRLIDGGGINWGKAQQRITAWLAEQEKKPSKMGQVIYVSSPPVTTALGSETSAKNQESLKKEGDSEKKKAGKSTLKQKQIEKPAIRPGAAAGLADVKSVKDRLGRKQLVNTLAAIISSPKQGTPLTMALLGDWGAGKSSVLEQLKQALEKRSKLKPDSGGNQIHFLFAEFNAWEYEHTDDIRAGLAHEVTQGLLSDLGFMLVENPLAWEKKVHRFLISIQFAWKTHRWEMVYSILSLIVIAVIITGAWTILGSGISELAKPLVGVGAVGGIVAFLSLMAKNVKTVVEHPITLKMTSYVKLPSYSKHLGMIPIMHKHLETLCDIRGVNTSSNGKSNRRLILYIDDLDRCHYKCITETLDAIRLVMDIPNVIVVIAVDHRIAFRAMAERYKDLADESRSKEEIARDYLGKIIQLPVMLPEPETMDHFIDTHLFPDAKKANDVNIPATTADSKEGEKSRGDDESTVQAQRDTNEEMPAFIAKTSEIVETDEEGKVQKGRLAGSVKLSVKSEGTVDVFITGLLEDTTEERELFKELSRILGFTNPRQLLRLKNTYRLIVGLSPRSTELHFLMALLFWHEQLSQSKPEKRVKLKEQFKKRLDGKKKASKTNVDGQFADKIFDAIVETTDGGKIEKAAFEVHSRFVTRFVLPHGEAAPKTEPEGEGKATKPE